MTPDPTNDHSASPQHQHLAEIVRARASLGIETWISGAAGRDLDGDVNVGQVVEELFMPVFGDIIDALVLVAEAIAEGDHDR